MPDNTHVYNRINEYGLLAVFKRFMNIYYYRPVGSAFAAGALYQVFSNPDAFLFKRGKEAQLGILEQKQDAWRSLNVRFLALKEAAEAVAVDSSWVLRNSRLHTDNFTALVADGAEPGTYAVQVQQLAAYHKIASDPQTNAYAAQGLTGTVTIDGIEIEIAAADSLPDIANWINVMNNATVVSDQQAGGFISSGGTIQINDKEIAVPAGTDLPGLRDLINQTSAITGVGAATLHNRLYLAGEPGSTGTVRVGDAAGQVLTKLGMLKGENRLAQAYSQDIRAIINDSKLLLYRTSRNHPITLRGDAAVWRALGFFDDYNDLKNEEVLPQKALLTVNGQLYERNSNTVADAIENIVITLKNTTSYAENLEIEESIDIPRQAIEDFVTQYNYAIADLNQHLSEQGIFRADQTVWQVRHTMVKNITDSIEGLAASLNEASEAGLEVTGPGPNVIGDFIKDPSVAGPNPGTMNARENGESLMKLSKVGIIYDQQRGTLTIDHAVLDRALASEPGQVQALFTNQADNLAQRFRGHMESLIDPVTGQVKTQIRVAGLLMEAVEKDGREEMISDQEISRRRLDYLSLVALQNMMAQQKEKISTSIF